MASWRHLTRTDGWVDWWAPQWREAFQAPSLWFGFVQLSTWCALPPASLPQMREAQMAAVRMGGGLPVAVYMCYIACVCIHGLPPLLFAQLTVQHTHALSPPLHANKRLCMPRNATQLALPNVGYATNADHGFGCAIHPVCPHGSPLAPSPAPGRLPITQCCLYLLSTRKYMSTE